MLYILEAVATSTTSTATAVSGIGSVTIRYSRRILQQTVCGITAKRYACKSAIAITAAVAARIGICIVVTGTTVTTITMATITTGRTTVITRTNTTICIRSYAEITVTITADTLCTIEIVIIATAVIIGCTTVAVGIAERTCIIHIAHNRISILLVYLRKPHIIIYAIRIFLVIIQIIKLPKNKGS